MNPRLPDPLVPWRTEAIEIFEAAASLTPQPAFLRFRLTDAAIVSIATTRPMVVFTEDRPLLAFLRNQSVPAFSVQELAALRNSDS